MKFITTSEGYLLCRRRQRNVIAFMMKCTYVCLTHKSLRLTCKVQHAHVRLLENLYENCWRDSIATNSPECQKLNSLQRAVSISDNISCCIGRALWYGTSVSHLWRRATWRVVNGRSGLALAGGPARLSSHCHVSNIIFIIAIKVSVNSRCKIQLSRSVLASQWLFWLLKFWYDSIEVMTWDPANVQVSWSLSYFIK